MFNLLKVMAVYVQLKSDKIKRDFFQAVYDYTTWTHREKAGWEQHKNATGYLEQILETTPHETTA